MPTLPPVVQKYAKFVVAVAGAVLTVANVVAHGGSVVQIVLAALTALGVHQVPNKA